MNFKAQLLLGVHVLAVGSGCADLDVLDNTQAPPAPRDMSIEWGCVKTQCDDVQKDSGSSCYDCSVSCEGPDEARVSCKLNRPCLDALCSDEDRATCLAEGYAVTPPIHPAPELEAQCASSVAYFMECKSVLALWSCEKVSNMWDPKVGGDLLSCLSRQSCEDLGDDCMPQAGTLGDDFCRVAEARCGADAWRCGGEPQQSLNAWAPLYRTDVHDSLLFCAHNAPCDEIDACVEAWGNAVSLSRI